MEQSEGYDFKADIWSLGITAIELAQGDAPNSELPAMRVLLVILNSPPPSLNKHESFWSQEFRDFVNACLQKNPSSRMSAKDLLEKHKKFLDKAKGSQYVKDNFLGELKPLEQRIEKHIVVQANEYFAKRNKRKSIKNGSNLRKKENPV